MPPKYFVVVANGSPLRKALTNRVERSLGLVQIYASDRAVAFIENQTTGHHCFGDRAVVIGTFFNRNGSSADFKTSASEGGFDRGISVQNCLSQYWGGYAAVFENRGKSSVTILRDPSAAMPCYYTEFDGGFAFASEVSAFVECGLAPAGVAWDSLASYLFEPDLCRAETCLRGITELLPGFQIEIGPNQRVVSMAWSPWKFVDGLTEASSQDCAVRLAETLDHAVSNWAGQFDRILLGLSGGLDSSILAACLAAGRSPWESMTLATDEPEGDERTYAAQVATHFQVPLTARFHAIEEVDIFKCSSTHLPRPMGHAFSQSGLATRRTITKDLGCDAFFSGIGGDNVFCYMMSMTPVVDLLMERGLTSEVLSAFSDIVHLTDCSVWRAARLTAAKFANRHRPYHWTSNDAFIAPHRLPTSEPPLHHPWLKSPVGALPGKTAHIAGLLRVLGTLELAPRTVPYTTVMPLLSQPVVELCLGIPTWKWCENGENRSIARQAFESRLPQSILRRRSKGGPDSFLIDVVETYREEIRELLLGGLLAQHELVDRQGVEFALLRGRPIMSPDHIRLSAFVEAELWARAWS